MSSRVGPNQTPYHYTTTQEVRNELTMKTKLEDFQENNKQRIATLEKTAEDKRRMAELRANLLQKKQGLAS